MVGSVDGFWVSDLILVIDLDAKIRQIPYGPDSRYSPDKGCLTGTRVAFLNFIIDWVNSSASERGLVIFGQQGTGKSSIAHEISRRFDEKKQLTTSMIFKPMEQSAKESVLKGYHLFTTLAHDLADRYPSFKIALRKVVKDNTAIRVGTQDYTTLFKSLILRPLEDLQISSRIFVVIDALDESGTATGRNGLHTFLAEHLKDLPSSFRVLITSKPKDVIVSAFHKAQSVKIKYMDDDERVAETRGDILTFFQKKLPSDKFGDDVQALANKADGSFQWAAVASFPLLYPTALFDYTEKNCIKHLLEPSTDHRGQPAQDLLCGLYKDVLKGYIEDQATRDLFRSVVGQLITSIEPLTIHSLLTLQRHASYGGRNDAAVTGLLRRLGSLLSNVTKPDENLPIVPLHTSFRDFLMNKDQSGDFYVGDAHHQLADSCLNLLLDPVEGLKFNICQLETSYLANDDVDDLKTRVDKHISPALSYACCFWDDHLKHSNSKADLFQRVGSLFKKKFLFWLETLSLTRHMRSAPSAFVTLNKCLEPSQAVSITLVK